MTERHAPCGTDSQPETSGTRSRRSAGPSVCFISLTSYAYFESDTAITPGGAERQLYLIAQECTDEFDVHFVVGDYGQPRRERRGEITLHRAYTPGTDIPVTDRPAQIVELYNAMRRADADVYVFRGKRKKAAVVCGLSALLDASWVYNLSVDSLATSGADWYQKPWELAVRGMLRNCDCVVSQSSRQKRRLAESFDVDSTVVPNGYPPMDPPPSETAREFFLFVGRLTSQQKRPHLFLDLAERLPEESFVVVGPRDFEQQYADRIERRASALPNVEFHGRVDPGDIDRYYQRAIALVNTSAWEGFPNTFLEAWRTETPVIGLEVDPTRFLSADAGLYADGEMDRLVSLTEQLAGDPDRRAWMGETARRQFEQNYTVSEVAERYGEILRSCS